jgi:hypothetical protein
LQQPLQQPQPNPSPEMPKEMYFPTGPNSPHVQNATPPAKDTRPQLASAQLPLRQTGQPPLDLAAVPAIFSLVESKPRDWETTPHAHVSEVRAKPTARSQAIADGRLVDVSELAHQVGFQVPVAITPAVWSICVSSSAENITPNSNARLQGILSKILAEAKTAGSEWAVMINVTENRDGAPNRLWQMQACCVRAEDDPEPAITILLPEENAPRR